MIPIEHRKAPVLLIVYNRPDLTERVLNEIRTYAPATLYIASDGPKPTTVDRQRVMEVRELLRKEINWTCEVNTLFNEQNRGCSDCVRSAITWFFKTEEYGIILEDDCLPSQTFFHFCSHLLFKYRNDIRLSQICGSNFLGYTPKNCNSYFFSRFGPIWGWATWRRSWNEYHYSEKFWERIFNSHVLENIFPNKTERSVRVAQYRSIYNEKLDTWDYQWVWSRALNRSLAIIPSENLIENIGFREDATHTKITPRHAQARQTSNNLTKFPLCEPNFILADAAHDIRYMQRILNPSIWHRFIKLLKG